MPMLRRLTGFDARSLQWQERDRHGHLAGIVLQALRENLPSDMHTRHAFATAIGETDGTMRSWEQGDGKIPTAKLPEIFQTLGLQATDEEAIILFQARLPALDPLWLARRPADQQAGEYLAALRQLHGDMQQQDLEAALDLHPGVLKSWEHEGTKIDGTKLPVIRKILALDESEYRQLIELRFPALVAEAAPQTPPVRMPTPYLRALEDAFGGAKHFHLADELEISQGRLTEWKKGRAYIRPDDAEKIATRFEEKNAAREPEDRWYVEQLIEKFREACAHAPVTFHAHSAAMGAALHARDERVEDLDLPERKARGRAQGG